MQTKEPGRAHRPVLSGWHVVNMTPNRMWRLLMKALDCTRVLPCRRHAIDAMHTTAVSCVLVAYVYHWPQPKPPCFGNVDPVHAGSSTYSLPGEEVCGWCSLNKYSWYRPILHGKLQREGKLGGLHLVSGVDKYCYIDLFALRYWGKREPISGVLRRHTL